MEALKKDRKDHIWATFKKIYFSPLDVENILKNCRVGGTPQKNIHKKSVSKMTQNGLSWILNMSLYC